MYKTIIKTTLIAFLVVSGFISFNMYQTYKEIDGDEL